MNGNLEEQTYVDVSKVAEKIGFERPVIITCDLHSRLMPDEQETEAGEDYKNRLEEVLSKALEAVHRAEPDVGRITFRAYLHERFSTGQWKLAQLDLWCCRQGKGFVLGYPEDFLL